MSDNAALRSQASAWHNQTWILLRNPERAPEQDLDLLALAQASFAAWMSVTDHTPTNEAIGAWLVSRVHAVVGEGRLAEAWARRSLTAATSVEVDPFYRAYAREALARAYRVQGRTDEVVAELHAARYALPGTAEDDLDALESDLADLEADPGPR